MIPKIIWQTHEWEYSMLPHNFKRSSQTWKNLNSGWEYRYHSAIDRAIEVKDFDKELYEYYMFADKVTQSDIWRYIVIYKYGGFYADMDSFCTEPLDFSIEKNYKDNELLCCEIIEDKILIKKFINNSHFAAIKESFILKEIIESIKDKYKKMSVVEIYNSIEKKSNYGPRQICNELWLGVHFFYSAITNNKDKVSFGYNGGVHSEMIKIDFTSNYMLNYFGTIVNYEELCKTMNWNDIEYENK